MQMTHFFFNSITVGFYIWRKSNFKVQVNSEYKCRPDIYYFNALLLRKNSNLLSKCIVQVNFMCNLTGV